MFQSQVKNQRCPLLPHSTVQATTSLWVRSRPPPAFRQDRAKGSYMRAHFHVSSFSRPRLWLEKNYIRGLLLYSEGQTQHLFTLCSMLNILFQAHHPLPLPSSSISALWIINYTEFSSAFILLSCGCHLPTEGKKKFVSSL